jgi:hypothetical protein
MACHRNIFLFAALCLSNGGLTLGQEAANETAHLVHQFADKEVEQYRFSRAGESAPLKLVPRSLLRWSNVTTNRTYGDTYVWTDRGCPRVIISVFAIVSDRSSVAAECQSLSQDAFSMFRNDQLVWTPNGSGVDFRPLKSFGKPAKTETARSVQMNRIARQFRAEFSPHTAPDEFTQLRLLNRPLFRYQSEDPEIVDGAIYGFVDATDPEMLLVIEGRKMDGETAWFYSPARSRHDQIRLYLNEQLVWDVPRLAPPWEQIRNPDRTYFNLRLEKIIDPEWWNSLQTK